MSIQFNRILQSSVLALAALFMANSAVANNPPTKEKTASKKKVSKKAVAPSAEEAVPNTADALSTDFQCEHGNKITIYNHTNDDKHVALRWKNKLLQLTRVDTSTGADRYENRKQGLVWIGIPAKGILLDAKKGQQLANECKSAAQMNLPPADAPAVEAVKAEVVKG